MHALLEGNYLKCLQSGQKCERQELLLLESHNEKQGRRSFVPSKQMTLYRTDHIVLPSFDNQNVRTVLHTHMSLRKAIYAFLHRRLHVVGIAGSAGHQRFFQLFFVSVLADFSNSIMKIGF